MYSKMGGRGEPRNLANGAAEFSKICRGKLGPSDIVGLCCSCVLLPELHKYVNIVQIRPFSSKIEKMTWRVNYKQVVDPVLTLSRHWTFIDCRPRMTQGKQFATT